MAGTVLTRRCRNAGVEAESLQMDVMALLKADMFDITIKRQKGFS